MSRRQFSGKVAVITGGALGIGRGSTLAFGAEGATVVFCDINEDAGKAQERALREQGATAEFVKADVTREADIEALMKRAADKYGRLDFLHNNAGMGRPGNVETTTVEDWDWQLNLVLKSAWLGMKHAIPIMIEQGGGVVVNTGSKSGMRYEPVAPVAYSAAKAAVRHLTMYAAGQYARKNIRVNSVSPAGTVTEAFKSIFDNDYIDNYHKDRNMLPRINMPSDIADAVVFLCSDRAQNITGIDLPVMGGQNL